MEQLEKKKYLKDSLDELIQQQENAEKYKTSLNELTEPLRKDNKDLSDELKELSKNYDKLQEFFCQA